jgi:hypothetical protein
MGIDSGERGFFAVQWPPSPAARVQVQPLGLAPTGQLNAAPYLMPMTTGLVLFAGVDLDQFQVDRGALRAPVQVLADILVLALGQAAANVRAETLGGPAATIPGHVGQVLLSTLAKASLARSSASLDGTSCRAVRSAAWWCRPNSSPYVSRSPLRTRTRSSASLGPS